ncbi:MGH1-like glycoside hydrolase domain-containing protein [Falsiroseomonas sp. HW251]|uniref:MGH1-like glycoside hydrolase domain-containing protein n=1 Tax=Falsiroseomonas sp. HW251 TaxID=3390998 RepID=UPI003D317B69
MIDRLAAQGVLRANDRGGYTVPTDRLYPFQWNWDSAFVAMGFATFDAPRAWAEIESLLRGEWDDGLIPQIVFHAPSDDYFPGPDVWGIERDPRTSGITQPPVLATAARKVLESAPGSGSEARMAAIWPKLRDNHRWWARARDPQGTGLVTTLHPWETGMDNSPAWDAALDRVPTTTRNAIRRRDTGHVDPAFRPRAIDYQRFIHLVECFADAGWDPAGMLAASPLRVADVGTNAILLRAERDLAALATRFGTPAERTEIEGRIARMAPALETLWQDGFYLSRDLISGAAIPVRTSAGFLPLFAGESPHEAALAATLQAWAGMVRWLVPSTDPAHPQFEPLRYWRGPVWAVVNWMIADGLRGNGHDALARRVEGDTLTLIDAHGFSEYFDPTTGQGIGGATFSWTAAIALLLEGTR